VADTGFTVTTGMVLDVVVSAKGAKIEGTVVDSKNKPVPGKFGKTRTRRRISNRAIR
jgi:hypothetical protein